MISNRKEFLEDLTKLTRKYKVVIGGCGCCDSPFLSDTPLCGRYKVDPDDGNLEYVCD